MTSTRKIAISIIYIAGFCYLNLPSPTFPKLNQSWRSTEEGDTWQNPNQKGYYSNIKRSEVIEEIQNQFFLKIWNIKFFGFRLNYPPEEAQAFVRDQLKSNYLEEIVFPLRESIFVNGWEPENDPKMTNIPSNKRTDLIANGQKYQAKITLYPIYSNPWSRLLVWTMIFPAFYFVFHSLKHSFND
jgi:hypothetical protein